MKSLSAERSHAAALASEAPKATLAEKVYALLKDELHEFNFFNV